MPNKSAAIKRLRRVVKQTSVNKIRKSKYRAALKKMDKLLNSKTSADAKKYYPEFQSILMQVAKHGTISKKAAARKASRVSKKIQNLKK